MYFMSISTFSSFFMNLQNLLNMVFMSYYHLFDGFTRFLFSFSREGGRRDCFSSFYYTTTCWDSVVRDAPAAAEGKEWPHTLPHTTSCATLLAVNDDDLDLLLLGRRGLQIAGHTYLFLSLLQHITWIKSIESIDLAVTIFFPAHSDQSPTFDSSSTKKQL